METFAAESVESYELELKNEACACVHEVIKHLKLDYRDAIVSVDIKEQTVEDFAVAVGITPTMRLSGFTARKVVAKELESMCGSCAEHKCVDCTCKKRAV